MVYHPARDNQTEYTTTFQEGENQLKITLTGNKNASTTKILTVDYITPETKAQREKERLEAELAEAEQKRITKEAETESMRQDLVRLAFSPFDGSHRKLVEFVKSTMNDPKSFEHVETKYVDQGQTLLVTMTFRGSNSFGGIIKDQIIAIVDLEGKVLQVLE